MFSIAAINDTDSREQWEPLAPSNEAQEFYLTQTYHKGLLSLQAKEYDKACNLLESVLKDPLIANTQIGSNVTDCHLLQLRFLALKNLASAFVQQGSEHYESALQYYLQAIEIDAKDLVIWNQLGTLACSMGLLSISRWAFEQGLLSSPNNWNCMEKLLEVLIAIRDEVACLSIAELILRHWPSHSRALDVKNTIEESELVPFAPKGIDKLKPEHNRLRFHNKRKKIRENPFDPLVSKKMKVTENLHLQLPEISWVALVDALLEILLPLNAGVTEEIGAQWTHVSGDVRLAVHLPPHLDPAAGSIQTNGSTTITSSIGCCNSESLSATAMKGADSISVKEQPFERRSSRLERLRNRKPDKELDVFATKDVVVKAVHQFLEPFVAESFSSKDHDPEHSPPDTELDDDVSTFIRETSRNCGAFHVGHLLLERAALRNIVHQDGFVVKLIELERLTRRNWAQDRTPRCNLFLAELCCDLACFVFDSHRLLEFLSESSYHLCKVIESVVSEYPHNHQTLEEEDTRGSQDSFWIRYFWLSGKLSFMDGNKDKAHKEFHLSLLLLGKLKTVESPHSLFLPHLKLGKELNMRRIIHEMSMLEVAFLLEETLEMMLEKELYGECIDLLAPLLLCTEDAVYLDSLLLPSLTKKNGVSCTELSAIDVLITACQKVNPMNMEVCLDCHRRKLKILMTFSGWNEFKIFNLKLGLKSIASSDVLELEVSDNQWISLMAEEVKSISQFATQLKNLMDSPDILPNGTTIPKRIIGGIHLLLLELMCHMAINYLCKKSCLQMNSNETEQKQTCCFVDACIAFCKLQHLICSVHAKTQIELIVAIHNLLAEYGLCCWSDGDNGEEGGAFLKFALKHLLALDMKVKSNSNASKSNSQLDKQLSPPMVALGKVIDATENKREKCVGQFIDCINGLAEDERKELELMIDNALDQCFFCLYGLNIRSDSSHEDDLAMHKNTSRGDYQTKEQCADVFQYILPFAKAASRTGLVKLRRVLRAIQKQFSHPPDDILAENPIDRFLNDVHLCEDQLSKENVSEGYLETLLKKIFPDVDAITQQRIPRAESCEPYLEVYCNLYYFLALSEEMSATDKWPGYVLTKEGEEFIQQNANFCIYDLIYNPMRFESWQRLANIYDEEVDLLLNDGSKHLNVVDWRNNVTLQQRVERSRRKTRHCLLMSLALTVSPEQQVVMGYCFDPSIKHNARKFFAKLAPAGDKTAENSTKMYDSGHLDEVWHLLYRDCLSALETCVEGDLKHFHKARYMLAKGLYKRGLPGDLEMAKDQLSFCFKSYRSSFTINMWEIDGMVKRRRKTLGFTGNKKSLVVNLSESSRKFITCIRKYLMFYMKLLEETEEHCTLDRALVSIRLDKRFALCIEDLLPVALGSSIRALISAHQGEKIHSGGDNSPENHLERLFSMFMEHGNLWPELHSSPEFITTKISESCLYSYLHEYVLLLERNGRLETFETINDKIKKRVKNPKLAISNLAEVYTQVSVAWCRSLIIGLASITPLHYSLRSEARSLDSLDALADGHLLCVDIKTNELWSLPIEEPVHMDYLKTKWNSTLSKINGLVVTKVSDENIEAANSLLRSCYSFYRESFGMTVPSRIDLYLVPSHLILETEAHLGLDGLEKFDLSIPRKLLLWAYVLLNGHYANIIHVVKYCEEITKVRKL